jgi:type II secretory pathway component PulF
MSDFTKSEPTPVRFWHRIGTKEKALFFEHLSNLVEGGVTALSALGSFLEKTANPRLSAEVSELALLVESGDGFSTAMKKLPRTFSRAEVSIVEAGEQSGTMQKSFLNIATDLRNREEIRIKLKSALTYPLVVMVFLAGAVLIVMTYVVPKLVPLFETSGSELPAVTAALMSTSTFLRDHVILFVVLAVIISFSFRAWASTYSGRLVLDQFFLRVPLVGPLYRNYLIVRVASMLSLLLSAGIPIVKTLRLSGESTGNLVFEEKVTEIAAKVEMGKRLAESIEECDPTFKIFTRDFVQIVSAGERTSTVNKVTARLADQYSREVDASIATLVRFVEPAAVLFAGGFVLWFALAIFSAVMKITESVG